jgi:hypothetical protein
MVGRDSVEPAPSHSQALRLDRVSPYPKEAGFPYLRFLTEAVAVCVKSGDPPLPVTVNG